MVGGTTPPQSDSGEISRVLVLNLLWQSKRCSRTAQDISVLTTPSLLSMGTLVRNANANSGSRSRIALKPLQVGANLRGVLVAQAAIFFQRFVDDRFELDWEIGIHSEWRNRGAAEDRLEYHSCAFASERQHPGRHLVENRAEGVQIRSHVELFGTHLLGRHVSDCAERRSRVTANRLAARGGSSFVTAPLNGNQW